MARNKKTLTEETLITAYNIKEARSKKYNTINDAAISFKVEKSLWRQWENAFVSPQKSMLLRVTKHLGVTVASLHQPPDNWETIKAEFLQELIGRTKVNKDYYLPLHHAFKQAAHPSGDNEPAILADESRPGHAAARHGNTELLSIFLQITKLITDARNKAHEVDRDTYDTHMQTIADMAKLSLLTSRV